MERVSKEKYDEELKMDKERKKGKGNGREKNRKLSV